MRRRKRTRQLLPSKLASHNDSPPGSKGTHSSRCAMTSLPADRWMPSTNSGGQFGKPGWHRRERSVRCHGKRCQRRPPSVVCSRRARLTASRPFGGWSNTTGSHPAPTPTLPLCASTSPPFSMLSASTTEFPSRRCLVAPDERPRQHRLRRCLAKRHRPRAGPQRLRAARRAARDDPARALNETFAADIPLRHETTPDLVNGIELTTDGQKVAWSITGYPRRCKTASANSSRPRISPRPHRPAARRKLPVTSEPASLQRVFDGTLAAIRQARESFTLPLPDCDSDGALASVWMLGFHLIARRRVPGDSKASTGRRSGMHHAYGAPAFQGFFLVGVRRLRLRATARH